MSPLTKAVVDINANGGSERHTVVDDVSFDRAVDEDAAAGTEAHDAVVGEIALNVTIGTRHRNIREDLEVLDRDGGNRGIDDVWRCSIGVRHHAEACDAAKRKSSKRRTRLQATVQFVHCAVPQMTRQGIARNARPSPKSMRETILTMAKPQ